MLEIITYTKTVRMQLKFNVSFKKAPATNPHLLQLLQQFIHPCDGPKTSRTPHHEALKKRPLTPNKGFDAEAPS